MTRRWAVLLLSSLLLAGCGRGSKQDILHKAERATTKAELERALGKPDRFEASGIGPLTLETWVYRASDGEVVFVITGDAIASRTTTAPAK